mmetsp:Transcript_22325/g.52739  ORF Transcript_22325/g.52739 Transcript_22325/m.52739 type:complete len:232 (-) Transcript_22325:13-708(-)
MDHHQVLVAQAAAGLLSRPPAHVVERRATGPPRRSEPGHQGILRGTGQRDAPQERRGAGHCVRCQQSRFPGPGNHRRVRKSPPVGGGLGRPAGGRAARHDGIAHPLRPHVCRVVGPGVQEPREEPGLRRVCFGRPPGRRLRTAHANAYAHANEHANANVHANAHANAHAHASASAIDAGGRVGSRANGTRRRLVQRRPDASGTGDKQQLMIMILIMIIISMKFHHNGNDYN